MAANPALPDRATVRVFPPAVPLLTILGGVVIQRLLPLPPAEPFPLPLRLLGASIVAGAVLMLGARSVALVRRSGQSENPWKPTTQLIQSGPFSRTRNPMYLQMVVGCVGLALALSNLWILILTPLCAATLDYFAIRPEEAYLERKFGVEYREYMARVPRWF
jgi:protein-S-isoprenylcysteine O-methyltransferase Ste14